MRTSLCTAFVLCANFLAAQSPTLTRSNYFEIGDSALEYIKYDTSLWSVSIGPLGQGVTWDFSAMDFGHPSVLVDTLIFVDPVGTPFYPTSMSADYSAADLCMVRRTEPFSPMNNDYNYYKADQDSIAFLGHWAANGGTELWEDQYPDPLRKLIFPLVYADSFTDQYTRTLVDMSGSGYHSAHGTHTVTVDGEGELITPDGDLMQNVLRLREELVHTDSSMFGIETTTYVSYSWYSADHKGFILSMEMAIDDPQMVQTASYRRQTNISTAIGGIDRVGRPFIHPNPATEEIKVILPGNEGLVNMELFDQAGRSVISTAPISDRAWIPLQGLSPGTYVIKCMGQNGSVFFDRVIVR